MGEPLKLSVSISLANPTLRNENGDLDGAELANVIRSQVAAKLTKGEKSGLIHDCNGTFIGSFAVQSASDIEKRCGNCKHWHRKTKLCMAQSCVCFTDENVKGCEKWKFDVITCKMEGK